MVPLRVPITLVVGRPLIVERVENPSEAQVSELHRLYRFAILEIYQRHRARFGGAESVCIM